MKTNVQSTSLRAYYGEILPNLGTRQEQVLEVFLTGEYTNSELAQRLNWPINTVTPRVFELRDKQLLEESTMRLCKATGRRAKVWKLKHAQNSPQKNPPPQTEETPSRSRLQTGQLQMRALWHNSRTVPSTHLSARTLPKNGVDYDQHHNLVLF